MVGLRALWHRNLSTRFTLPGIRQTFPSVVADCALLLIFTAALASARALPGQTSTNPQAAQQVLAARAEDAQHRHDYRAAAQIYREMLKTDPHSAELRANLGLMDHLLGDYPDAIRNFQAALQEQPRLFVPNLFMGLDLLRVNKPRDAVSYLQVAHGIHPDDPNSLLGLGGAYKASGDLLKARKFYEAAVRLNPAEPRAWLGLGLVYSALEEEGSKRIEKESSARPYLEALEAESLVNEGRLSDAIANYVLFFKSGTLPPCLRSDYGFALLRSGRVQEADLEFRAELSQAPRCSPDRLGLAGVAIGRGDMAAGVRELSELWAIDPNFLSAHAAALWQSLTPGEIDGFSNAVKGSHPPAFARLVLRTLDRWRKEPVEVFAAPGPNFLAASTPPADHSIEGEPGRAKAQSFYLEGKFAACRDIIKPALRKLSEQDLLLLAQCAYSSGDFRTAFLASDRAKEDSTPNPAAWYWRTKASEALAVGALMQASAAGPDSAAVHVMLGDVYLDAKKFVQAEAEYRKAVDLDPHNVAARVGVAAALYRLFLLDQALPELKTALQIDPQNPEANFMMADILAYRHKFREAEPYAKAALQGEPSNLPLVHALLGRIYASQGFTFKAIRELQQSLPADHDGSFHYQIAMLYKRAGDPGAARAALRESEALRKSQDANKRENTPIAVPAR